MHLKYLIPTLLAVFAACREPIAVTGRVLDSSLRPFAGLLVTVNDGQSQLSRSDGAFTAVDVHIPYQVIIADTARKWVVRFENLTRPDPTLELIGAPPSFQATAMASPANGKSADSIAITLVEPADLAFVNRATLYRWTGPSRTVYLWMLGEVGSGAQSLRGPYIVFTTSLSTTLPKPNMTGFDLVPNFKYGWTVIAFPTFASVDDATGPDGLRSGEAAIVLSQPRTVYPSN